MPDEDDEKITFAVPDTGGEPALFLGLMYAATRSEDDLHTPGHGLGTPLYSSYIFPYAPSEEDKKQAEADGKELPLFVSYIFPYLDPEGVILAGGGGGGHAALGGAGVHVLFVGEVFSFIPAEPEPGKPSSPPA
jgi:hypothetical protein